MSFITNQIAQIVSNGTSVSVQPEKYGKYPVIVTDTTNSLTSGWSLTYNAQRSKFEEKLVDFRGRFSEIMIANASGMISDIEAVYAKFRNGEGVRQFNNTSTATYETEKVWYTLTQRPKGVSLVMTITDELSPFHMLQVTFFVMGEANGRHPLIGFDHCYNQQANTWTDKRDSASLSPSKRRVIPVNQDGSDAPSLAKVAGQISPNGMIALDLANTQIDYIQNYTNERRLIAGLYETAIMNHALTSAMSNLPASQQGAFGGQSFGGQQQQQQTQQQQTQQQGSFGGQPQQQQQGSFGGQQQQQQQGAFGGQQQNSFGGAPQQSTFGGAPQQNTFGGQQQQGGFGTQPQANQQQQQEPQDMPTW